MKTENPVYNFDLTKSVFRGRFPTKFRYFSFYIKPLSLKNIVIKLSILRTMVKQTGINRNKY